MSQDPLIDDAAGPTPSLDAIRERAHDLWERHHRPEGYELEFWLMAERELKAEGRTAQERQGEATLAVHPTGRTDEGTAEAANLPV